MADSADSKRSSERIPFDGPLKVTKPAPAQGKGVDIAAGGIALEVPTAIPEGSKVEVELFGDGTILSGVVRMVKALDGGGFRLGVQFDQADASLITKAKALRASAG